MSRVAVVAPKTHVREALVKLARAGNVELVGNLPPAEGEGAEALRRLAQPGGEDVTKPVLLASPPDVPALEQSSERGLLAGEVELERRARLAVDHGSFSLWLGWAPTGQIEQLSARLGEVGSAVVELPLPPRVEPPTLLRPVNVAQPFRLLVQSYGTARYREVDPTRFTAVTFVVMFGMMFGDVGHGLVLALLGLLLRQRRRGRLAAFQPLWLIPFVTGLAAAGFGFLYGEAFGPTGLVPTLWLNPVEEPVKLLTAGLAVGAVLLTVSYLIGIVNRRRESGADRRHRSHTPRGLLKAGGKLASDAFSLVTNLISFARLGAFGLMHAALGAVVLYLARGLWGGLAGSLAAAAVFVLGNLVAFALEALVTAVQALRLEYYELFSRFFSGEGHAFAPWSMPVLSSKEES